MHYSMQTVIESVHCISKSNGLITVLAGYLDLQLEILACHDHPHVHDIDIHTTRTYR